ncbi:zf-HC2 domain-containing protein [Streptomyces himalayensis]|uniref:Zf-HC2 domain-containing protein n=1 Tax=Streptomyces himalayensis subsp. himalayensis TaxID=2756131 RepID=A0A7W0I955_9ACTN|nr:zf-HC2 domain-containing protein [Streptomyces himalayensis]MBA2947015.1 zf-HC2 domain-containing protein [Streptomyces himalayensis subsp. himalayensis]
MRSLERHRDAGAYALGVLDATDAFRFEEHLMECPGCVAQVSEFGPALRQLMLYTRATPRGVAPLAVPRPRLLDRLLGEVAVARRARRRRGLCAVAAAVVLAVAGPATAIVAGSVADTARVSARDGRTGVAATLTTQNHTWGTQVGLAVWDAVGPRVCELVAVGKDGTEQKVTSWTATGGTDTPMTPEAGTALHPDEIDHFEIRTADGKLLVMLGRP